MSDIAGFGILIVCCYLVYMLHRLLESAYTKACYENNIEVAKCTVLENILRSRGLWVDKTKVKATDLNSEVEQFIAEKKIIKKVNK